MTFYHSFGRRRFALLNCIILILGPVILVISNTLAVLIVGRVITGIGNIILSFDSN